MTKTRHQTRTRESENLNTYGRKPKEIKKMELLTKQLVQELLAVNQAPCLSLYMPTHQTHPENLQDIILFKNLVKQLEESLLQKYSAGEVQNYLEPLKSLENDQTLWDHTLDGLAIFSATGLLRVVRLHNSVEELAIVADSFHTKPLRYYLQSLDNYNVMCLTLHDIRLFEGNRHTLTEVEFTVDIQKNTPKALCDEPTDKHLNEGTPMQHVHSSNNEDTEKDTERFFRLVANAMYENHSKSSGWPLILAALPEHHNLFKKANKNPLLLSKSISMNPSSVSTEQLAKMAWEIMEPEYNLKLDRLVAWFEQEKANGKGSDDYKEVAVAAVEGRVDALLVEANRIIAVRVTNLTTGNTQKKDLTNPKVDDLLDDMGELVLKMGGKVMVLPTDKMPTETGLAAIFRY